MSKLNSKDKVRSCREKFKAEPLIAKQKDEFFRILNEFSPPKNRTSGGSANR
jgi:hypothetical protein